MLCNSKFSVSAICLWLLGILCLGGSIANAEKPPINTLKPGVIGASATGTAILGYDSVAYFTENKPVPGLDAYTYSWMGAKWKFSSQKNLDLFKATPEKYAPQYGGYCAYGVAKDNLVKIDPAAFSVIDGKLYLNYDKGVQKKWAADTTGYIKAADAKFAGLLKK
jgi:YHS domain-containing protein